VSRSEPSPNLVHRLGDGQEVENRKGDSWSRERAARSSAEKTLGRRRRGQRATAAKKRERVNSGRWRVRGCRGQTPRSGKAQGGTRGQHLAKPQAWQRAPGGVRVPQGAVSFFMGETKPHGARAPERALRHRAGSKASKGKTP